MRFQESELVCKTVLEEVNMIMTQEEKAKRYDEAIERAKNLHKDAINMGENIRAKQCEIIFPELKESEDERIRKDIIEMLRNWASVHYITKEQFSERMAWLEKQGKETSWKPSKEAMDVLYGLAYITNQYDEHKEEIITRLYQDLKREFFNGSSYENMFPDTEDGVRRRSTIQVLEYVRSLDNYNQYGKADIDKNIAWLEKQGEPNPYSGVSFKYNGHTWGMCARDNGVEILVDGEIKERVLLDNKPQGKSALEAIQEEKVDNANKIEPNINPHFGKPNKVEPKFKDGDWITNGNYTWQVISVDYLDYTLQNQCGECVEDTVDYVNKAFHLWTIQDAKDGDVLAFDNGTIVIFKDLYNSTSFHSYCYIECGIFDFNKDELPDWWEGEGFNPSTKEQSDILFQKMKEAGYEWDADKKELRKEEIK
jgi:hypothetical protein